MANSIDEINNIIERIISKINYDTYDKDLSKVEFPFSWTFQLFFERFDSSLKSCQKLISELEEFPLHDMAIGLIIRTMILDCMTLLEILSHASNSNDVKPKIHKLLVDNFLAQFKDYKNKDDISEKEKILLNEFDKKFSFLFKDMGLKGIQDILENNKMYKYKTPSKRFSTINTSKYKSFAEGYYLYLYYSKYEHFGAIYPVISRANIETKRRMIKTSFEYIESVVNFIVDNGIDA